MLTHWDHQVSMVLLQGWVILIFMKIIVMQASSMYRQTQTHTHTIWLPYPSAYASCFTEGNNILH